MAQSTDEWLTFRSSDLVARVDPLGAQLSVLRDHMGHDLLWNGDPTVWSGRAPLLFPIVGALAGGKYRWQKKLYELPRHGFARNKRFDIMESTPDSGRLSLKADEATRQVYPFEFELQVYFQLRDTSLSITATVHNAGNVDMPASFGYHPAFCWPLPYGYARERHFIEFETEEGPVIRRLTADGLLDLQPRPTPIHGRRLNLSDGLFRDDVLILDQVRSHTVSYGAADGPRLRVSYPDCPYLGFWSKPSANFVCIEPWHGIADPAGFSGDFNEKPGVFMLPPGGNRSFRLGITLEGRVS